MKKNNRVKSKSIGQMRGNKLFQNELPLIKVVGFFDFLLPLK